MAAHEADSQGKVPRPALSTHGCSEDFLTHGDPEGQPIGHSHLLGKYDPKALDGMRNPDSVRSFDNHDKRAYTDTYGNAQDIQGARTGDVRKSRSVDSRRRRYRVEPGQMSFLDQPGDRSEVVLAAAPAGRSSAELTALLSGSGPIQEGEFATNLVQGLIERDLSAITMKGVTVNSPTDAAALLAAYRSPSMERMTWLLVGTDGTVRHHGVWSLGDLTSAMAPTPTEHEALLQELGAQPGECMAWCHNHPSGDPTPSANDRAVYRRMNAELEAKGLKSHFLVLDGDHYAQVSPRVGEHTYASYQAEAFRTVPSGFRIDSPERAAEYIKGVSLSPGASLGIYVDVHACVVGVQAFPSPPSVSDLRGGMDRSLASRVLAVVPYGQTVGIVDPRTEGPTWLSDVVEMTGGGTVRSHRRAGTYRPYRMGYGGDDHTPLLRLVMERTGEYSSNDEEMR